MTAAGSSRTAATGGFGIVGMQERVRTLGGSLDVANRADGAGVVVSARLPARGAHAPNRILRNRTRQRCNEDTAGRRSHRRSRGRPPPAVGHERRRAARGLDRRRSARHVPRHPPGAGAARPQPHRHRRARAAAAAAQRGRESARRRVQHARRADLCRARAAPRRPRLREQERRRRRARHGGQEGGRGRPLRGARDRRRAGLHAAFRPRIRCSS